MIDISLNGQRQSVAVQHSLSALLQDLGYRCEKVAVAINGEFVARGDYETIFLRENDCVDVVAPVQGG